MIVIPRGLHVFCNILSCYLQGTVTLSWVSKHLALVSGFSPHQAFSATSSRCQVMRFSPGSRAPDKVCIFITKMPFSSQNPMFEHLLESSHRDDSNKWSNVGFGEEIT